MLKQIMDMLQRVAQAGIKAFLFSFGNQKEAEKAVLNAVVEEATHLTPPANPTVNPTAKPTAATHSTPAVDQVYGQKNIKPNRKH